MRFILPLLLVLSACNPTRAVEAPKPVSAPAAAQKEPANLICEAFKGVDAKATCTPYFTDVGPVHVHAAMIAIGGQQLYCRHDVATTSILCSDPIVVHQAPPPPTQDAKPETKPEAKTDAKPTKTEPPKKK